MLHFRYNPPMHSAHLSTLPTPRQIGDIFDTDIGQRKKNIKMNGYMPAK